uniref:Macaca fascicularis brain cDNA clone: QtrA-16004, similar to human formin-like 1 (FMNL1), mRNA, RefSeq: NM_005892.3 n=1 Tax=Macaca fascicularis TaxID=9541 RepID=I7GHV7_MACFA|nr:unnamed protein product [Macaca fascicularis]
METASPGPRRIRINPFSSSSSTFSSRAEGRVGAAGGALSGSGGRLEAPMAVDSLKRSCEPHGRGSVPTSRLLGTKSPSSSRGGGEMSSLEAEAGLFLGARPTTRPSLTRRVSNSLRAWLSCFSSSAILAMDSFSASRSRSVSCSTGTW